MWRLWFNKAHDDDDDDDDDDPPPPPPPHHHHHHHRDDPDNIEFKTLIVPLKTSGFSLQIIIAVKGIQSRV